MVEAKVAVILPADDHQVLGDIDGGPAVQR
jgi:hypothetical protein